MLRKLWSRWVVLAHKIGNFQSRVLLTLLYYTIVAPFGLGVTLLADPLQIKHGRRRHDSESAGGWIARETTDLDVAAAKKQS